MAAQVRARSLGIGVVVIGVGAVAAIWYLRRKQNKPAWLRKIMPLADVTHEKEGKTKPDVIPDNEKEGREKQKEEADTEQHKPAEAHHTEQPTTQADEGKKKESRDAQAESDSITIVIPEPAEKHKDKSISPGLARKHSQDRATDSTKSSEYQKEFLAEKEIRLPANADSNSESLSDIEIITEGLPEDASDEKKPLSRIPVRHEVEGRKTPEKSKSADVKKVSEATIKPGPVSPASDTTPVTSSVEIPRLSEGQATPSPPSVNKDSVSTKPKNTSPHMSAGEKETLPVKSADDRKQQDSEPNQYQKQQDSQPSQYQTKSDQAEGKADAEEDKARTSPAKPTTDTAEDLKKPGAKKKKKKKKSLKDRFTGFMKDVRDRFDSSSDEDSSSASEDSSCSDSEGSVQDTQEKQSIVFLAHPTYNETTIPFGCSIKTITEFKKKKIIYKHVVTDVESENFAFKIGFESSTESLQQFLMAINNIHTEFMSHEVMLAQLMALNIEDPIHVTLKKWIYASEDEVTEECLDYAFKFMISDEGEVNYTRLECKPKSWQKDLQLVMFPDGSTAKQGKWLIQHAQSETYLKIENGIIMMAPMSEMQKTAYNINSMIFYGTEVAVSSKHHNDTLYVFSFCDQSHGSPTSPSHFIAPIRQDRSGFCEIGLLHLQSLDLDKLTVLKTQNDHRYFYHKQQHDGTHIFESSIYPDTYLASKGHSLFMKALPKSRLSTDKDICFKLQPVQSALPNQ